MGKKEIRTSKAAKAPPGALFSQGIKAGDLIFISGSPTALNGTFIRKDFQAAVRQNFENLKAVAEAGGSSLANAVRVDGYMRDFENFKKIPEIYLEYFPKPLPALGIVQIGRPPTDTPLGTIATVLAGGLKKEEIKAKAVSRFSLHSQGVKGAGLIFTQGAPLDLKGRLIEGDFKACAMRAYENAGAVLQAAGSSLDNSIRVDVYLRDLENLQVLIEVHKKYLNPPYPAFSACQPARQLFDSPLSIMVTALEEGLEKEEIKTSKAARAPPGMYFSQGIKAGDYIIVTAGPFDLGGKLVDSDFKSSTRKTYENIREVLEAAGSSMDNLVRTDNYIRDLEFVDEFNEAYAELVPEPYPCRGFCQPTRMPMNLPVAAVAIAMAK